MEDHPLEVGEDATTFFQPRAMVFVTMLWVIALGSLACVLLILLVALALGVRPTAGDLVRAVEALLIVPVAGAGLIVLAAWNRFGWLKSSIRGLEFGATGRRGVHLPWSAVAAVGLRRWGPFTELVITPSTMTAVTELPGPGRRPRLLRRDSGPAFLLDVGLMSPGPDVLLAELHRRIPARV
ncbi:hypothetical protein Asp14428_79060 [Actinoplanes sp. NBRC 14428]|uniref:Uncharacterized protein n=1 Tax=Pseudosporangium ferrugineum TaxID=439699 RepID=A0A2T0SJM5_9ACTN|nr:hypothetical protein [Pseudosporangium ferrugineum]PRY33617.1 hypothetical protein CLV70_101780 [Pseudosporangium ferrugineum]BCJ56431.1 hypothetical protein Asp14428_79060 [Actinoplanes sp. NBRC 14428]